MPIIARQSGIGGILKLGAFPELCYDEQMPFVSNTYQNHLKFGYGPDMETVRTPTFFNIHCGEAAKPGSFFSECVRAASLIAEKAGQKRILVAMSGGLDSEVVARSFLAAKVPFEAVIFRYEDDSNLHDIQSAIDFCHANNVKTNFVEVRVIEFLNKLDYLGFTSEYFCNSPLFAVHLEGCRQVKNDFVVISGSAPSLRLPPLIHRNFHSLHRFYIIQNTIEQFMLSEYPTENTFCFEHFFVKNNCEGVSNFFLYTPELVLSSLLLGDPVLQFHEVQHFSPKNPHSEFDMVTLFQSRRMMARLKQRFFIRGGFDVGPRDAKFTGFEKLQLKFSELPPDKGIYERGIDGLVRFNQIYRAPMEARMPVMKLINFQISDKDREILLANAFESWAGSNISIF